MRESGLTYEEIAGIYKVSISYISKLCTKAKIIKGKRSVKIRSHKRRDIEKCLREGGKTQVQIAKELGVTRQYVNLIQGELEE
jgi:transcriptional regulator